MSEQFQPWLLKGSETRNHDCQNLFFEEYYYSLYKNIKDITTIKYPFAKKGTVNFNIAGEHIIEQQGQKKAGIRSNSFGIRYIKDIDTKDELIDFAIRDLDIGVVSQPVTETGTFFYLFLVSERDVARSLDEEDLLALQSQVLNDWLISRNEFHKITYHGFNNGFDSETYAWVNWQLSKN